MTSYTISVGYNSMHKKRVVSDTLRDVALMLCDNPELIINEATYFGERIPYEYAEAYKQRDDLTIQIIEPTDPEGDNQESCVCIKQVASGTGESRKYKEAMRRGFCRLVIREIHRRGMEVELRVS